MCISKEIITVKKSSGAKRFPSELSFSKTNNWLSCSVIVGLGLLCFVLWTANTVDELTLLHNTAYYPFWLLLCTIIKKEQWKQPRTSKLHVFVLGYWRQAVVDGERRCIDRGPPMWCDCLTDCVRLIWLLLLQYNGARRNSGAGGRE